jgi:hypothetical protein
MVEDSKIKEILNHFDAATTKDFDESEVSSKLSQLVP